MKSSAFNFVILPSNEVSRIACDLSEYVARITGTEFILDGKRLYPHATLYQAQFPIENLSKLKEVLESCAKNIRSFRIRLNEFSINYKTFLFWSIVKNDLLTTLHSEIVRLANPLREGLSLPHLERMKLSSRDEADKQKYGSLLIGPNFRPHITITRLKEGGTPEDILEKLQIKQFPDLEFSPSSIALGYLGKYGTVTEIVEKINL